MFFKTTTMKPCAARRFGTTRGFRDPAGCRALPPCQCPKRRLHKAASPPPSGRCEFFSAAPAGRAKGWTACPTTCPTTSCWLAHRPRYPLAMISPPARNFLNSSFVNVKSLRDIEGEPLLEMHADDAASARHPDRPDGARLQRPRRVPLQSQGVGARPHPAWSTAWASGGASWAWTAPT